MTRVIVVAVVLANAVVGGGCSSPWRERGGLQSGAEREVERTVRADWDDVEASLLMGALQSECSFVTFAESERGWQGEAISIHDDAFAVSVSRAENKVESVLITVRVRANETSDVGVARLLVEKSVKRLRQLHGVKTAPLERH
jgi:hypothetical protein